MKARLAFIHDQIELLTSNGKIKALSLSEAKDFLLTYDSLKHYMGEGTWDYSGIDMVGYGGTCIAHVSENNTITILNGALFRKIMSASTPYLTTSEYAEKVGKQRAIVIRMCRNGRIPGAIQKGSTWLIPEGAPYPDDARVGKRVP